MLRLRLDRGWGSREGVYEDMRRREMDYVGMMLDYHICIALHGMAFFDRCVDLYIQVICLCGWLVKSRSSSPFFSPLHFYILVPALTHHQHPLEQSELLPSSGHLS
jgi:hypothetical protein